MRRGHQPLDQVDVALRVEVREQLLSQVVDLDFEDLQKRCGRSLMAGRKRLGALAQSFQENLAIPDGAKAHREPAQLRAQRLRPLRVEQRAERAQV